MENKKEKILVVFLFLTLFSVNYNFLDKNLENFLTNQETPKFKVERVIDGDTFKGENETIRMLGINTPETGEKYYEEAKNFLKKEISNASVNLEFGKERKDRYGRTLAYVFLGNKDINLELVENGFANYYFPSGKDKHYNEFKNAWEKCIEKNINLCEKSYDKCSQCIELSEFEIKSQKIILKNNCDFSCEITDWEIKDEGRKNFVFPVFSLESGKTAVVLVGNKTNIGNILYWKNEGYVWTGTGDTLFLRDENGKLVLWESY